MRQTNEQATITVEWNDDNTRDMRKKYEKERGLREGNNNRYNE